MEKNVADQIKKYARFKRSEDITKFEKIISEILKLNDSKYIPILMNAFDDETEFEEVMYSLVHAVESYPKQAYISSLIKEIPHGLQSYPYWLEKLVNRIFNDEAYLSDFRKNMHLLSKEDIIQLLDLVAEESEHHEKLCTELKKEILERSE